MRCVDTGAICARAPPPVSDRFSVVLEGGRPNMRRLPVWPIAGRRVRCDVVTKRREQGAVRRYVLRVCGCVCHMCARIWYILSCWRLWRLVISHLNDDNASRVRTAINSQRGITSVSRER